MEDKEDIKFRDASMKELLEKYNDCNLFSLTAINENEAISSKEYNEIKERLIKENKQSLKRIYDQVKNEVNIDFEVLYADIKKEVNEFRKNEEASFICDKVGEGTKYSEPYHLIWHMYNMLGIECDLIKDLDNKKIIEEATNIECFIDDNRLKNNVCNFKIGFQNHCTNSSEIMVEIFFYLNEQTKEYLLEFKDDYSFINHKLQDLAFYKDDKLRFSSCTHEGFHSDIK